MAKTGKAQNCVPKYEEMDTEEEYAFTYAPSDIYQFWDKPERFDCFKQKMRTFLTTRVNSSLRLRYRHEISPHGRLHLHGYIQIPHKLNFYLYTVPLLEEWGTLCIKPITTYVDWDNYCLKQDIDPQWEYLPIVTKPLAKPAKRNRSSSPTGD